MPVLSCHEHFLSDVGEDLLEKGHNALAAAFRAGGTKGIRGDLRKLARELGRKIGNEIDAAREALLSWQMDSAVAPPLPRGRDGLAVVRALAQWVLAYAAESTYGTFPFDRPWLDFYDRVIVAHHAATALSSEDRKVSRVLGRLRRALDPIVADVACARTAATLRTRAVILDEFRATLRIIPRSAARRGVQPRGPLTREEAVADLQDVEEQLDRWKERALTSRATRDPKSDEAQAIDVILAHLDRHGGTLFGHVIPLPPEAGGGVRLVDRTNNIEEEFFRTMKHAERRRSGRKNLTCEFEKLPSGAALAQNLRHDDYVKILCGSLDELPHAFARLDAQRREAILLGHSPNALRPERERRPETASLPTPDRKIVRNKEMTSRIHEAARTAARKTG